ncbi:MAG: hypothetical protein QGI05_01155, partial [Candidatus Omnitrophota bacterium]|nr:hypothetical protein [Candidatus Omnitrophota bacterium]
QNVVVSFNKMVGNLSKGLSQVMGVSDRLSTLIDKLSEHSRGEILLEEDIRNVVGELKENKQNLKKALSYFKVKK